MTSSYDNEQNLHVQKDYTSEFQVLENKIKKNLVECCCLWALNMGSPDEPVYPLWKAKYWAS